jgi:hypothetical protein
MRSKYQLIVEGEDDKAGLWELRCNRPSGAEGNWGFAHAEVHGSGGTSAGNCGPQWVGKPRAREGPWQLLVKPPCGRPGKSPGALREAGRGRREGYGYPSLVRAPAHCFLRLSCGEPNRRTAYHLAAPNVPRGGTPVFAPFCPTECWIICLHY